MKSLTIKIIVGAFICLIMGTLSGFSTVNAITNWYQFLIKPSFNPPNWIFGPVWTVLYLMMGISLGIIWNSTNNGRKRAMQLFAGQFVLNLCWSYLFFNLHALGIAYLEILSMIVAIIFTIFAFYKINKTAAFLLVPYLCWVLFASFLNLSIWYLNK
jgi:tryptophan-rich sensory protein